MTSEELKADYAKALDHAAKAKDRKGNANAKEDLAKIALNGVRTSLYAKLSAASPAPARTSPVGATPAKEKLAAEIHHLEQKAHNVELWEQVEAMVAAAGLTEGGSL